MHTHTEHAARLEAHRLRIEREMAAPAIVAEAAAERAQNEANRTAAIRAGVAVRDIRLAPDIRARRTERIRKWSVRRARERDRRLLRQIDKLNRMARNPGFSAEI